MKYDSPQWTLNVRMSRRRKTAYVRAAHQAGGSALLPWMWRELDRLSGYTPCDRCDDSGVMHNGELCQCNKPLMGVSQKS